MNATEIAAALSARAEDVCRRYLPRGRKQGRYWTAGDTSGAKGRSLFVRLAPPGIPGKWTDAATNEHGDLLDLIRLHSVPKPWTRTGRTARSSLLAPFAPTNGGDHVGGYDRKQLAATGGVAAPSMAPMQKPICTPAPSAIAVSRPCGSIPISSIGAMTASTASRRWSPPSPAMMAPSRAYSAPGSIPSAPPRGRSLSDRARRSGASTAGPCALAGPPAVRSCLSARASKLCYLWLPPFPAFMLQRLYRRAAWAPSNHPKTSPCWSSPAIKTWKAGTPPTVFSSVAWNAAFPQP